jgi:hypothetical protein
MSKEGSIFKSYFDHAESTLLGQYGLSSHAGHSVNKGTPREEFVRGFLKQNVGNAVTIGEGEIISAGSYRGERRKQQDIVLYDSSLPRLEMGGGITSFLREGVFATVEVKSLLTQEELDEACDAGLALSDPKGGFSAGHAQSWPRRFLVAYDGPKKMDTVFDWLEKYYRRRQSPGRNYLLIQEGWSPADEAPMRHVTRSSTLDGVFVLGKGFVLFEGFHFSLEDPEPVQIGRTPFISHGWTICDTQRGTLHTFFLAVTDAIHNKSTVVADYAKELEKLPRVTRVMDALVRI